MDEFDDKFERDFIASNTESDVDSDEDTEELERLEQEIAELKEQARQKLGVMGQALMKQADEQVRNRAPLEERWLEDVAQYNGIYDSATLDAIRQRKGSEVFVNITRHKTNTAEARLADMLFPTDDRNWGIQPTPVPTSKAVKLPESGVFGKPGQQKIDIPSIKKEREAAAEEARQHSKLMEMEIDDQLNESDYNAESRQTIHDAVLYGTGILKGPVIEGRYSKRWVKSETGHSLSVVEELTPCARHISVWDFFPDMSATRTDECEFFFERHYFTKRELADLAQIPGFEKEAIREVLSLDTDQIRGTSETYISRLRALSGYNAELSNENRYEVWEYTGPIEKEILEAAEVEYVEDDLYQTTGTVWVCEGKVLRVTLNPMDTGDSPYSVYCFQEDDTSVFGIGVPYMMRNAQAAINSAWRMIMDNSGLSSGPQIIINRQIVEPLDGDWTLTPRKLWALKDKTRSVHEAFGSYNVESHQSELANVFQIAKQLADEETSIPLIAQGEAGNQAQTASGMSMLMNNANIVLRRSVKIWDDSVTRQIIQRFYDWNMQFNEKEEIKGDFQIDARGSSVLMAREVQMQSMMGLLQISQSPAFAPLTDFKKLYKLSLRHMQMPVNDVMLSDEEIEQAQQAQAEQGQQGEMKDQIAMEKLKLDQQRFQADQQQHQQNIQIKQMQLQVEDNRANKMYEADMAKIASSEGKTMQQLQTQLGLKQMQIASDEKLFAFESKVKQAFGTGM